MKINKKLLLTKKLKLFRFQHSIIKFKYNKNVLISEKYGVMYITVIKNKFWNDEKITILTSSKNSKINI